MLEFVEKIGQRLLLVLLRCDSFHGKFVCDILTTEYEAFNIDLTVLPLSILISLYFILNYLANGLNANRFHKQMFYFQTTSTSLVSSTTTDPTNPEGVVLFGVCSTSKIVVQTYIF